VILFIVDAQGNTGALGFIMRHVFQTYKRKCIFLAGPKTALMARVFFPDVCNFTANNGSVVSSEVGSVYDLIRFVEDLRMDLTVQKLVVVSAHSALVKQYYGSDVDVVNIGAIESYLQKL